VRRNLLILCLLLPGIALAPAPLAAEKTAPGKVKNLRLQVLGLRGEREILPKLVHSIAYLMRHGELADLSEDLRRRLSLLLGVDPRRPPGRDPALLHGALDTLRRWSPTHYDWAVKTYLSGLLGLMAPQEPRASREEELPETVRGWNTQPLAEGDPAYDDPDYVLTLIRRRHHPGLLDPADPLLKRYRATWRRALGDDYVPVAFTQTGSDANNLLLDIAELVAQQRVGSRERQRAGLVIIGGAYVAGRGPLARAGFPHWNDPGGPYAAGIVTSAPFVEKYEGDEELRQAEAETLAQVRRLVAEADADPQRTQIGGVLVEAIPAARGVYSYRKEFLEQLLQLCEELKMPLIADEIFTGGGLTGKPFAIPVKAHILTVGKRLAPGIAIRRKYRPGDYRPPLPNWMPTVVANAHTIAHATRFLDVVHERNLIDHAHHMESVLKGLLRKNWDPDARVHGLLAHASGLPPGIKTEHGRLTPLADIAAAELEQLLARSPLSWKRARQLATAPAPVHRRVAKQFRRHIEQWQPPTAAIRHARLSRRSALHQRRQRR
jgi:hypothetical protein